MRSYKPQGGGGAFPMLGSNLGRPVGAPPAGNQPVGLLPAVDSSVESAPMVSPWMTLTHMLEAVDKLSPSRWIPPHSGLASFYAKLNCGLTM